MSSTSSIARLFAAAVVIALALVSGASTALQAQATLQVVASGLDNPRGITLGPDGALYVAEAGRGGTSLLCHVSSDLGTRCYGPSGAVTRITGIGVQQRVLTGLPSIAQADGNTAQGPNDIEFGLGSAWILIGFGGNPLGRQVFEAANIRLGSLVRATGIEQWAHALDIADHELNDPDGTGAYSNPFGLRVESDRILVADAGANALFHIGLFGQTSTIGVFPAFQVGPATVQSVPTAVVEGPDGALYVAELTGAPFLVGAARIYRLPPGGGTPVVVATGFTNIIDLVYDSNTGNAYVLEHDADGIIQPGVDGRLIRIGPTGALTVIAQAGLVKPGGVAVGADGALYVTRRTDFAGTGDVVRIVP